MGRKPAMLLHPRCPTEDDAEIHDLLELLTATTGATWAELALELDGGSGQRYSIGDANGGEVSMQLDADGFRAELRMSAESRNIPGIAEFVKFSLEKILRCNRYREQASLLRGALDTTSIAVLLFDDGCRIVYANSQADHLLSQQTENDLAIEGLGDRSQPLMTYLLSTVENIVGSEGARPSWTETLRLSDGSVLACEVLHVDIVEPAPSTGVLTLLQPVPAHSKLCLDSFCAGHGLSPREQDVIRLLFEGLATSDMADRLNISLHTVRDHLKRVYKKTGTRSRSELLSRVSSAGANPSSSG
jgi:DNA-binding CsgD family transcriptional regulator